MTRKDLKLVRSAFLLIILISVVVINVRLRSQPEIKVERNDTINVEVLTQLRGLKNALGNGADADMQRVYPEGYVFMNALYALAWTNFIAHLPKDSEYFKEGYFEISNASHRINSRGGRSTFIEIDSANFGAFYSGWNNYVLAKKLSLLDNSERDPADVLRFLKQSENIAASFEKSVYPVSYPGSAWPADAVVCMASLALYDKMFEPLYTRHINRWISKVRKNCDSRGFIPHAAESVTGKVTEEARGSSMSLMLIFLNDIDQALALEQYKDYRAHFVDEHFDLAFIREYPKGSSGSGDIDSGPVFFGIGSAATLAGMHTLALYNDSYSAAKIRNQVEAFGFPFTSDGKKNFLFGKLPIADAFITWGYTAQNLSHHHAADFLTIHVCSLVVIILLAIAIRWLWKPRSARIHK
ncbi:MAG TPA: hypothetical protein VGD40_09405 [Chryseosolibacter sp.]